MRYKNVRSGAVVDSSSIIKGKDWEEFKPEEMTEEVKESEYVDEEVNLEEMTKAELVELAKEHEIEVNEKDAKAVIIEAITTAFE